MINVSFKRNENGDPIAFRMCGHAGYDESGHDIICAAVSALMINFVNSVEALTKDRFVVEEKDEAKGLISFSFKGNPSSKGLLLIKSFELGVRTIREENCKKFIRIKDWEV